MATQSTTDLPKPRATGASGEAATFYYERDFGRNAVKVLPGEFFVSPDDIVLSTVLGSCISACIWDRTAAGIPIRSGWRGATACSRWNS